MLVIWDRSKNWGDRHNPILIKYLSGKNPRYFNWEDTKKINKVKEPIYLVAGSILHKANKKTIVWGTGFISAKKRLKEKPRKICAVRGPLTRQIILKQKIPCPKIYGDPALLFPLFYKPKIKKKYKLGIIPHYIDQDGPFIKKFQKNKEILIININAGIKKVIKEVLSCEKIASSSLHGIILADAYKISSTWIKFSNKVKGRGFKFRDYFMSVKRKDKKPLTITKKTKIEDIFNRFYNYKIKINLRKLLKSCPFKKNLSCKIK